MTSTLPIGRRYVVPFLREVPIWKYGPIYNVFGEYVRDGWSASRYGQWEVSREEADRLAKGGVSNRQDDAGSPRQSSARAGS